ncbi:hypothetical protein [Nocardioides sp. YIM 152315]|uniref:hypothetical protein n=1 Tax=Nocardioides sp. YIM 152315 TaxID=3031760 RepID=UPI0023DC83A8|nr:hypothetical protein [Nocardioides sp. YIM 152315]MDF1603440.1 hypothetical protein [Nocardioides sp. YIM 152315]
MTTLTRLYGLTVRSEVPLHQDRPAAPSAPVDLDIVLGARRGATDAPPPGRTLLDLRMDRQLYTGSMTDDAYHLRFYNACDIEINREMDHAVIHPVGDTDEALLSVIAGGTLLAFVLALRGETVLHASAVQVGDVALGFVGASGMGKSTTATLMCADGGRLITDDLLRLDLSQSPPTCSLGATELRLRKAAGDLAGRFERQPTQRITGDERDALAVSVADTEGLPLVGLVVPAPDHSGQSTRASVHRLGAKESFIMLSRFPRLLGWQDTRMLGQQFQQLGDVVERVPLYVARLPWGPPFAHDLAADVRRAVGIDELVPAAVAG